MQTPDELARLNHYLGIHGLPPMDNPRAVVQALAFLIETEPEFRRVLAKCRPELRRDMYEALKPQLSFPVKPLDVYIAELGMEAEAKRLPTIYENGQLHEYKVPEVMKENRPDCACVSSDAHECMRRRYQASFLAKAPFDEDDYCECYCHAGDQDGLTEWDKSAPEVETCKTPKT